MAAMLRKPHICELCSKGFSSKQSKCNHKRLYHPDDRHSTFPSDDTQIRMLQERLSTMLGELQRHQEKRLAAARSAGAALDEDRNNNSSTTTIINNSTTNNNNSNVTINNNSNINNNNVTINNNSNTVYTTVNGT